jgi:hypothetical protein
LRSVLLKEFLLNPLRSLARYIQASEKAPAPPPVPVNPADRDRAPVPIRKPKGRQTYQLNSFNDFLNPFSRVQSSQNFALYYAIRESLPIVDAMISKTRQLIGCPYIDADDETKREMNAWGSHLFVNHLQQGLSSWLGTWIDNGLLYGRAHTEMILNREGTDIYALQELHPRSIYLRPNKDMFTLDVVQQQPFVGVPVELNPFLMLNLIHDLRGDDPSGTSLLWGLPFVSEIMQKLFKSLGATWDRFGTPRYHVNWQPPDTFSDDDGSQSDEIMAGFAEDFTTALESGIRGDVVDFYTSGKVTVDIIGAQGETLSISQPMEVISQQVVSKSHIPPIAYGFSWARGETVSQIQADLLTTLIDSLREEITPSIMYLLDFRQRISGGNREFKLIWPKLTLIDVFTQARADFFSENARDLRQRNNETLWRRGIMGPYDVVRAARPDLCHLTNEEIQQRLPDLILTPPDETAATDTGSGRTGTGGGGGLGPGSIMRDHEIGEALKEHGQLFYRSGQHTNGNGTHGRH